jgi:copper chaperone CopZ
MTRITVSIDGMMCGMCEAHICDAVRRELDVKKVKASHTKKQAVIISENDIPDDALRAVIDKTGYTFLSARREPYIKKAFFR